MLSMRKEFKAFIFFLNRRAMSGIGQFDTAFESVKSSYTMTP